MAAFHPRQIIGKWREGYALDVHTVSSVPIGYNEYGHMQFETTRSELGELFFRLKYRRDQSVVEAIVDAAAIYLQKWNPGIDLIVPVPPSNNRTLQPVILLAVALGQRLGIPVEDCIVKTRSALQLKNVFDLDKRLELLDGLHTVEPIVSTGRRILLFDDLYRSGATMNAIASMLASHGAAAEIFTLTITRTRSFR